DERLGLVVRRIVRARIDAAARIRAVGAALVRRRRVDRRDDVAIRLGDAPEALRGESLRPQAVALHRMWRPAHHAIAAMKAEAGMVKIHAQTMLPATPQRTVDMLRVDPTPTMAPVIVCVVETGMPSSLAMKSVIAPPVS